MKRGNNDGGRSLIRNGGISRRELLKMALACAGALFLPDSLFGQWPFRRPAASHSLPQERQAGGPAGAPVYIDPHTHIFNARDIAIASFLSNVHWAEKPNWFTRIYVHLVMLMIPNKYETAATVLVELLAMRSAPTIAEERRRLEEHWPEAKGRPLTRSQRKAFQAQVKCENDELRRDVNKIVRRSMDGKLRKAFPDEKKLDETIEFLTRLLATRYQNAARLIEIYGASGDGSAGEGQAGITIFTPSLMDMGLWLGNPSPYRMSDQVAVMSKIARLWEGRILPFISYDPWRQAFGAEGGADCGKPLQWVQEAVEKHGFVGVKIYPQMGFYPIGNRDEKSWPKKRQTWKALNPAGKRDFGAKLDNALEELYLWCEKNAVPLMAHGSKSMGAAGGYGKRGAPKYWAKVLERHRKLRLNLGHFGGWKGVERAAGWTRKIAELMHGYDHVYADVADFERISEDKNQEKFARGLRKLIEKFPVVEHRILYGSDWFMETSDKYFSNFDATFKRAELAPLREKFFGGNAAEFLGLHKGNKARERLEEFYCRQNITPAWIERLDAGS